LLKKPGDFDENTHITKDQLDVKSQNQQNLFFETKNLFKKRMWEAIGWDAIPIIFFVIWLQWCTEKQANESTPSDAQTQKNPETTLTQTQTREWKQT